jgi:hypothetical protein
MSSFAHSTAASAPLGSACVPAHGVLEGRLQLVGMAMHDVFAHSLAEAHHEIEELLAGLVAEIACLAAS